MKTQNGKIKTAIKIYLIFLFLGMAACSRKELDKENSTVDKAQTYHLQEKRQRVIRYDCLNNITSDRIETVQAPVEHVSIKPKVYDQLYTSSFDNVTLGKTAGSIVNYTDFTIDRNPGALNLEVQLGSNEIKYSFFYCRSLVTAPDSSTTCGSTPELGETGSIFINVTYDNIDLEGETLVKPTAEQCAPH